MTEAYKATNDITMMVRTMIVTTLVLTFFLNMPNYVTCLIDLLNSHLYFMGTLCEQIMVLRTN